MTVEKKAKDILKELSHRKVLGHKLLRSVGRRKWERPKVAISAKLYRLYAIPDPYLPSKEARKWLIGLGPVSLKLGENRRQPAPHLRPKEPPKKKVKTTPSLPNVPRAQTRKTPAPKESKPAIEEAVQKALAKQKEQGLQRKPSTKKVTDLASEFGAGPAPHKLARLPVRPDLQLSKEGKDTPIASPAAVQRSVPIQRSIPKPQSNPRSSNGRIRMQRTKVDTRFRSRPIVQPAQSSSNESPADSSSPMEQKTEAVPVSSPPKKTQPVRRTAAPKDPNSLSLDDLFGVPGDKPMRLRSNRKKKK